MISEVFNEHCEVGMAKFPDRFFDLAIVDPPYGIDFASEKERKPTKTRSAQFKFKCKEWDKAIPDKSYFTELFRVSKNQIIWGGNYFLDYLPNTNCIIIWDKLNPDGMRFSDGEMAWASFETSLRIYKSRRTYTIETQIHPNQKPIPLYAWILKNYAKSGDKILDTHMGSQSSRVAAYKLGFDYYGWETDEEYFKDGNNRFKNDIAMPLFDSATTLI
jgi:site-specific DNA-methyltransferase (adenine-specific)